MDIQLPSQPGRQRRIVYGDIVRARMRRQQNFYILGTHTLPPRHLQQQITPKCRGLRLKDMFYNSKLDVVTGKNVFCPICQDDLQKGDIQRTLVCCHVFHAHCVDQWLSDNVTCPLCCKSLQM